MAFGRTKKSSNGTGSAEKRSQFIALYGLALMFWGTVELQIEMIIRRELRLSTKETAIVCSGLGAGAKVSILFSLLQDRPECAEICAAVRAFQETISRNALAHGFAIFGDGKTSAEGSVSIVSREVKNGLSVKVKSLDRFVGRVLTDAYDRVSAATGFTDEEVHDYGREIAALAPAP